MLATWNHDDIPIHAATQVRLGYVTTLGIVDALDFLDTGKVLGHHVFALSVVVEGKASSLRWSWSGIDLV